jgi:hypothetical protein
VVACHADRIAQHESDNSLNRAISSHPYLIHQPYLGTLSIVNRHGKRATRSRALEPQVSRPTQSSSTILVEIPQAIKDSLRKFRFARRNAGSAAIVIKINKAKLIMEEVEQFDNITIEELAEGGPHESLWHWGHD